MGTLEFMRYLPCKKCGSGLAIVKGTVTQCHYCGEKNLYMEYIIPIVFLLLYILYSVVKSIIKRIILKYALHIHKNVKDTRSSAYWYTYRCNDCGNIIYEQPSGVNTSYSTSDVFIKPAATKPCKKD